MPLMLLNAMVFSVAFPWLHGVFYVAIHLVLAATIRLNKPGQETA